MDPTTTAAGTEPPILLIIDLQVGLVSPTDPSAGERSTPNLTSTVSRMARHFRSNDWPIIHVLHDDPDPDHPLNKVKYPDMFAEHACAAEPAVDGTGATEPVLHKSTGSAFATPSLHLADLLRARGAVSDFGFTSEPPRGAEVVLIGMDGAQCINDNARAARDLGFPNVTVVADACASFGMPDYRDKGVEIGPEETHTAAMSILANGFAKVLRAEEWFKERGERGGREES